MSDLQMQACGHLEKMETSLDDNGAVNYQLPLDQQRIPLNQLIGKRISLEHWVIFTVSTVVVARKKVLVRVTATPVLTSCPSVTAVL